MDTKKMGYWTTTGLLAFFLASGGVMQLARVPANVEGVVHLGYPVYVTTIVGFWKVLGAVALLWPRLPRLKEWAYAGAFFELTGAAASHAFSADAPGHVLLVSSLSLLVVASWALRPESRRLGEILPARAGGGGVPAAALAR
jgi:uncharacterized membrane protein YphA (DoxX/SURF4 family)